MHKSQIVLKSWSALTARVGRIFRNQTTPNLQVNLSLKPDALKLHQQHVNPFDVATGQHSNRASGVATNPEDEVKHLQPLLGDGTQERLKQRVHAAIVSGMIPIYRE